MQRSIALGLGAVLVALAARSAQAQYPAYPQSYPNPYGYQQPMAYPQMQYPQMQYPQMQYPPMQYPGYGVPGYPQMPQQPVMMMPVPVSVTRVVPMQGPVEAIPQGGPLTPEALAAPSVVGPSSSTVVVQPAPGSAPAVTAPAQTIVPTAAGAAPRVTPTPVAAAHPAAAAETPHTTKEETKGWFRRAHDYLCGPKFQMDAH